MRRLLICSALLLFPVASMAGTDVWGVGETVQGAMSHCASQGLQMAKARGTCISRLPSLNDCKKHPDVGLWECKGVVANHHGSCAKQSEWDKFNEIIKNASPLLAAPAGE